jgi:acetyl-CoA C-acetyltransferase
MNRNVAVIGTGETVFRSHHPDKTYVDLAQEAVVAALRDANVEPDEIDAVVYSMAPTEFMGVNDADKWAVDYTRAAGKPFMRIHTGGATGGSAFHGGWLNIAVTMIALMTQRYIAMRGLTEEQAARVVVRSRRNAMNNPFAHLKGQITVDDVMNSRPVSTPYKLFDICPRSSGACAVVLACEEVAREKCAQPAFVHGIGGIANTVFMGDRMGPHTDAEIGDFAEFGLAARECYRQAKITDPRKQIKVAELYDPFSGMQFPKLESLGFCKPGEAAKLSDEGAFDMDGEVAVNPSGGTLCTNPIGVTGLVRHADAAKQIMGRAGA